MFSSIFVYFNSKHSCKALAAERYGSIQINRATLRGRFFHYKKNVSGLNKGQWSRGNRLALRNERNCTIFPIRRIASRSFSPVSSCDMWPKLNDNFSPPPPPAFIYCRRRSVWKCYFCIIFVRYFTNFPFPDRALRASFDFLPVPKLQKAEVYHLSLSQFSYHTTGR